ncbi:reverse transcriptase domain-containing protein [Tanacetum coccineum]|uniref:Reverse transcriptase domain-containing protein n=1 Tax=Tanacetum coccineum TaxID=301880 RepID=A0ABQ5E7M0_9ASTR
MILGASPIDTFYNALNVNDQDSLNSAAGGNFLDKRPADCSSIIESKSKVHNSRRKFQEYVSQAAAANFNQGNSGIEVDRAKTDVIAKLPSPRLLKGIRSFLGHAGFYRRFIQNFSKIARPMTHLLEKETPFYFSKECIEAFNTLKENLTEAPILIAPDWNKPFELMCDASDFALGAVLGVM